MKVAESPAGVARLVGEVPGTPAVVYRYLTQPELLVQWWPEEASADARTDGRFELAWPSRGMRLLGRYLVTEPGRRLVCTWAFAHESIRPRTVDIQLAEAADGTRLTIEHTHGDDPDERQGYIDEWKFFINRLRAVTAEAKD